jgi:hypothetical protein
VEANLAALCNFAKTCALTAVLSSQIAELLKEVTSYAIEE